MFDLIYAFLIFLRVLLTYVMQPGYIHPDEFYQSVEVMSGRILDIEVDIPWEFNKQNPIRSIAVLELIIGVPIRIMKYYGYINPLIVSRLSSVFFSVIIDVCICKISKEILRNTKLSIIIFGISHIALVFQTRTLSNSWESVLVTLFIAICLSNMQTKMKFMIQGFLITFGIFCRPTFLFFVFVPLLHMLSNMEAFSIAKCMIITSISSVMSGCAIILIDTVLYESETFVITPLNFFLYNRRHENLAKHGLHPFYTHFLVNIPQLFGVLTPVLFSSVFFIKSNVVRLLSCFIFVPLLLLSAFPHQEMRFLLPIFPISCILLSCILLKISKQKLKVLKAFIIFHALFSFISVLFWGYLHEGGLVKSTEIISKSIKMTNKNVKHHIFYYKALIVPKFLFQLKNNESNNVKLTNLMGIKETLFWDSILEVKKKSVISHSDVFVHLVLPKSIKFENSERFMQLGSIEAVVSIPGHINTDLWPPTSMVDFFSLKYIKIKI